MRTEDNSVNKPTHIKLLHRFHFLFLYVFLYTGFRNNIWFVQPMTETEHALLSNMAIFFFIWFFGVNLYLANYKLKEEKLWPKMRSLGWNRDDYLSPVVLILTVTVICALELFVFDR